MRLKPYTTVALSALFVAAGIAATMATGLWETETDKTPRKLSQATAQTVSLPDNAQVTMEGSSAKTEQYDPADIRGSYTFGEISDLFGVPLADLAKAFGLEEEQAAAFQAKSLEKQFPDAEQAVGTASIRMFVAFYLGVSYSADEETWLPNSAAEVLAASGQMTAEQAAYLAAHTLP